MLFNKKGGFKRHRINYKNYTGIYAIKRHKNNKILQGEKYVIRKFERS